MAHSDSSSSRRLALKARLLGQADDRGARGPVLGDGSTGSVLLALAPAAPERLALLPLEGPGMLAELHEAYFQAGSELVETATFQASAQGLESWAAEGLALDGRLIHDASELAYRVNLAAARLARQAADAAEAASGQWRYVAGSMGPGDRSPSLGFSNWAGLKASYLPQARGLADGGCDLAIVETCQDPLQVKAALAALADPEGGLGLPAVVSATVDARGHLLVGTSLAALVAILAPYEPLALGLNCSGGPAELEPSLAELAASSPLPLSFMPNAGIPAMAGGRTVWPLQAQAFASLVAAMAGRHGVALLGGCCGTGPAHIAALAASLGKGYAIPPRPAARPALASLYEAQALGRGLFRVGGRADPRTSPAFAAYLAAGDFDGAAAEAVLQEDGGAKALDLRLGLAGRDEGQDLSCLVTALAGLARAALCLHSGDPRILAQALPLVGGRPLINSVDLEDPQRASEVLGLARDHGAAVVCQARDEGGPGATAQEKARICRRLYELAVGECGLAASALLFDPLGEDLGALALIKEACPGSLTILGSEGFRGDPKALLERAEAAGLDAAILDWGRLS